MAACAVLTLAACASGTASDNPSASRSTPPLGDVPTVQAFTQAPPFVEPHTRTVIEDVEKLAHPTLIYEGKAPTEYELPIVSSRYYALWDTNDVHRASIYERNTGNLVREVCIPDDARRFLGRILFTGTDAFVVDSPDLADRNTETGKITRLDLLTGTSTEVPPSGGPRLVLPPGNDRRTRWNDRGHGAKARHPRTMPGEDRGNDGVGHHLLERLSVRPTLHHARPRLFAPVAKR
ncbi:hypothetical protein INS90_01240 [Trueperella pecoris]|uniref:Uncharacterized protein n=1 Tax=Trueperella pecoris TaxID=2733571 RepID=A0A7M1R104_9ACTO|nr:hypothetical protein [Trueperella pecoris]QOR47960.1 hypothetical protein INS90_01240 [Trueperella pecoris]